MSEEHPCEHARSTRAARRAPVETLRWRCAMTEVGVASTAEVEPIEGVIGQDDALEALRFGLEVDAEGQNIYVRGLTGTGRATLVRRLLQEVQPSCPLSSDRCYVHDFEQSDRPALVTLPRGRGRAFRDRIEELITYLKEQLLPALGSDEIKARRAKLERGLQEELQAIARPFEAELAASGLGLTMVGVPGAVQPAILPVIDGEAVPPERVQQLVAEGRLTEEEIEGLGAKSDEFGLRFAEIGERMATARQNHSKALRALFEGEARSLLSFPVEQIAAAFPAEAVRRFLAGIVEDVVSHQLQALGEGKDMTRRYRVNLILAHGSDDPCPILIETQPNLQNLVGTIERQMLPGGGAYSDHLMIRGGALLRADGGYLVLEARDVLTEPGAWRVLVRTLRTGQLEISPQESLLFGSSTMLKPEPIPVKLKVILIGDPGLYGALDAYDPDFPHLFKVLADFDSSIPRDGEGLRYYTGVLARIVREEGLAHFGADAVAALAEHGARIAGRNDRLTTRFGRLADLAREAAFLARKGGGALVGRAEIRDAIRRSRRRGDLPARRFREEIAAGTIRIQTAGERVGQVNGLAVTHAGPLTYGFPARITATIGPGNAGTINIEREAQLSGSIHTKGFYILGGLLRHLMRDAGHPLAFSASIAFEQTYGGIDGDSASGAEICCLLSALTGVPLRQGIAMTGAIDQLGHVQPIGAASEKIEGFFDVCADAGLSGEQGVIIPRANLVDLMLREDVVAACAEDRFHVWAVESIGEALEIFTGCDAGEPDEEGLYPEGTLLARAVERAGEFWLMAMAGPAVEGEESGAGEESDEEEDEENGVREEVERRW